MHQCTDVILTNVNHTAESGAIGGNGVFAKRKQPHSECMRCRVQLYLDDAVEISQTVLVECDITPPPPPSPISLSQPIRVQHAHTSCQKIYSPANVMHISSNKQGCGARSSYHIDIFTNHDEVIDTQCYL